MDGSPQAFTYGHHPNNARIVISEGLLDLLDERGVEAVVAHEIGQAKHWDMLIITLAQLVPLVLYYIYCTLIRIRTRGRDKGAGFRYLIAIGSYFLYVISEYLVLWFFPGLENILQIDFQEKLPKIPILWLLLWLSLVMV